MPICTAGRLELIECVVDDETKHELFDTLKSDKRFEILHLVNSAHYRKY